MTPEEMATRANELGEQFTKAFEEGPEALRACLVKTKKKELEDYVYLIITYSPGNPTNPCKPEDGEKEK